MVTLDQGSDNDEAFWAYLGEGEIQPADELDRQVEEFAPLLFKLPEDPEDEAEQIAKGERVKVGFVTACKLPKSLLNDSDVFLLDAGWELFLWVGSKADKAERLGAISKADHYCQEDMRTGDLPMTIVKSGNEPQEFLEYFH